MTERLTLALVDGQNKSHAHRKLPTTTDVKSNWPASQGAAPTCESHLWEQCEATVARPPKSAALQGMARNLFQCQTRTIAKALVDVDVAKKNKHDTWFEVQFVRRHTAWVGASEHLRRDDSVVAGGLDDCIAGQDNLHLPGELFCHPGVESVGFSILVGHQNKAAGHVRCIGPIMRRAKDISNQRVTGDATAA